MEIFLTADSRNGCHVILREAAIDDNRGIEMRMYMKKLWVYIFSRTGRFGFGRMRKKREAKAMREAPRRMFIKRKK